MPASASRPLVPRGDPLLIIGHARQTIGAAAVFGLRMTPSLTPSSTATSQAAAPWGCGMSNVFVDCHGQVHPTGIPHLNNTPRGATGTPSLTRFTHEAIRTARPQAPPKQLVLKASDYPPARAGVMLTSSFSATTVCRPSRKRMSSPFT